MKPSRRNGELLQNAPSSDLATVTAPAFLPNLPPQFQSSRIPFTFENGLRLQPLAFAEKRGANGAKNRRRAQNSEPRETVCFWRSALGAAAPAFTKSIGVENATFRVARPETAGALGNQIQRQIRNIPKPFAFYHRFEQFKRLFAALFNQRVSALQRLRS